MNEAPQTTARITAPMRGVYWLNWVAFGLALIWIAVVASTITTDLDDFEQYWQAAVNIRETGDAYATTPQPGAPRDPNAQAHAAYPNPPLLAYLFLPLSYVPVALGLKIWFGLNTLILMGFLAICMNVCRSSLTERWWGAIAFLVALAPPTRLSLQLGQISIILAFLCVAAWWLVWRQHLVPAALVLALGALIKLFPGFLVLYYLRYGPRRVVWWSIGAGFALVTGSLLVHGATPYRQYLNKVLLGNFYPYAAEFNVSLVGFFRRLLLPSDFGIPIVTMPLLAQILIIGSTLAVVIACWCVGTAPGDSTTELLRYATFVCAMLLITPVNGIYNLVLLAFPALAGLRALEQRPDPRLRFWLLIGLALTWVRPDPVIVPQYYDFVHRGWGLLLLSPALYGLVIVFVAMVLLARRSHPSAEADA